MYNRSGKLVVLRIVSCATIICYASFATAEGPTATDKPATLSTKELREGVRRLYANLWALEVEYSQSVDAEDYSPLMQYHFALKGEKRLREQSQGVREGAKIVMTRPLILAFDGEVEQQYQPDFKEATIVASKQRFIDSDPYCHALAIPVSDRERASVETSEFFLPFALDNGVWEVEPHLQRVGTADCHVLKSDRHQRIWIDPQAAYMMRYREIRTPDDQNKSGDWSVQSQYTYDSMLKLDDDVWLPRRIEAVRFDAFNEPALRATFQVARAAVKHDVKDELFTLRFPTGTVVRNEVTERFFRIGAENEELDMLIEQSKEFAAAPRSSTRVWMLAVNVIVIIAITLIIAYRLIRRHAVE